MSSSGVLEIEKRDYGGGDGEKQGSEARLEITECKAEDEVGDGCGVKQPKQYSPLKLLRGRKALEVKVQVLYGKFCIV